MLLMLLGLTSHIDFKKILCCRVDFKGQGPQYSVGQWWRESAPLVTTSMLGPRLGVGTLHALPPQRPRVGLLTCSMGGDPGGRVGWPWGGAGGSWEGGNVVVYSIFGGGPHFLKETPFLLFRVSFFRKFHFCRYAFLLLDFVYSFIYLFIYYGLIYLFIIYLLCFVSEGGGGGGLKLSI